MTPREISSVMRRLFYGFDAGGDDPWRHLMKEGALDRAACNRLLDDYIAEDEVLVFADRQHALRCKRADAFNTIAGFMAVGTVRIANLSFTSKVIISPIGVGQGHSKADRERS